MGPPEFEEGYRGRRGSHHPNKGRAASVLGQLVGKDERFITDVEVYQEIIHRYTTLRRLDMIGPAFDSLDEICDEVLAFGMSEIRMAKGLVETGDNISARDALHIAIMRSAGVSRILSFDSGFDSCVDVERIS